jgi:ring-1,2-phenylacetyl-CoA epoxidase subunit PaaC
MEAADLHYAAPAPALAPAKALAPVEYLLHLADNAVVLGQRNAEWNGHAPILEEDIAMANNSLDLIGQARMLYQYAAERLNADVRGQRGAAWPAGPVTEDTLAYFRDVPDFRNYSLLELPHRLALVPAAGGERDWGVTIVRNYLYSALMVMVWERLAQSTDAHLAAIAAKSLKEVRYHLRHSGDWLVRLGDGTAESHARAQAALDYLLPFTEEFWIANALEASVAEAATGVQPCSLRDDWDALVDAAIAEATLKRPPAWDGYVTQGKSGVHTEHLGYLLAEMQSLARAHPGAVW